LTLGGPLLWQAPVGRQRLLHNFALHAVRDASAGAVDDAGNLPVDLPLALPSEGVGQSSREPRQLCAEAICDSRRAIAAYGEISAVGDVFH
jgi:hypothetical protein